MIPLRTEAALNRALRQGRVVQVRIHGEKSWRRLGDWDFWGGRVQWDYGYNFHFRLLCSK